MYFIYFFVLYLMSHHIVLVTAGTPVHEMSSEYSSSIEYSSLELLSDLSLESDGLVIESEASDIDNLGCSLMESDIDEPDDLYQSLHADFLPTSTSTPQKSLSLQNIERVQATPKPVSARKLLTRETFASGNKLLRKMIKRENIMKTLMFECSCGLNCIEKFDFATIKAARFGYWSKNERQRCEFVTHMLQISKKHQFIMENGVTVCKKAFMTLLKINKNLITLCNKRAKEHILSHRAFKALSPRTLQCMTWIEDYASFYGDRMPNSKNILLSYRTTKTNVYNTYCQDMKESSKKAVSRAGFNKIWRDNFPNLKIKQTNSFSKCTICTALERRMEKETSLEKKEVMMREKCLHNDRQMFERKYYYAKRDASRKHPKQFLSLIIDGMDQSKTNLPHIVGRTPKIINPADLLKTHLTGVIDHGHEKFSIYVDINQYPHDPNLTMNILLKRLLKLAQENDNNLPRVLYLQADNCWRENKNRYVMAFFELLVREDIFDEVHISFLFVGHTHEDVDAGFSRIGEYLRRNDAETLADLVALIPNSELLTDMLDIKSWLEPQLNIISKHTAQHHFKFSKHSGTILVSYKLHQSEEWLRQEESYLFKVPKGRPKILKSNLSKLDMDRLKKQINSMEFLFSDISKKIWWDKFIKGGCLIKDKGAVLWIDLLPRQNASPMNNWNINAIPEQIRTMIGKETEQVKIVSKTRQQKKTQPKRKRQLPQQKRKQGKKRTYIIQEKHVCMVLIDREIKRQIWLKICSDLLECICSNTVLMIFTLLEFIKYLHLYAIYYILRWINELWMVVLYTHIGILAKNIECNVRFYLLANNSLILSQC